MVGADGRDSQIAELAGVKEKVIPHGRFAYGGYFEGALPDYAPDSAIWFMDPHWAAAFSTDSDLVFYAAMPTKELLPEFKRDPTEALVSFLAGVPERASDPRGPPGRDRSSARSRCRTGSVTRSPPAWPSSATRRLPPIPLFGVGCGWAFQSGEWLADSVAPALRGEESLERGLKRYRRTHKRKLGGHEFMIHDYSSGRKLTPPERMLFSAAARDPKVAATFDKLRDPPGRARQDAGEDDPALDLRQRAARAEAGRGRRGGRGRAPGANRGRMSAAAERSRLKAGGTETRLVQAGPADSSEALVFVHGNPGSADDWEALVAAAGATGTRAVAFDLPDFGETLAPPGFEHSTEGYATFVGEALEALGIERVHLVLHDFGGPIGLAWAMGNPDALAGVVLIDTGILPGYKWHTLARVWRTPVLGELFQAASTGARLPRGLASKEPRGLPAEFLAGHGRATTTGGPSAPC